MKDFKGRSVFVTGGASGIGLAIAEALRAEGARVTIADIDGDRVEKLSASSGFFGVPLDVSDFDSWSTAKAAAQRENGPVDLLVNNAGIGANGNALADVDPRSFNRLVQINLCGTFFGISTFAGDMRERGGGHILNTASIVGLAAQGGIGGYCATKFGVVGMSEALRQELEPHGVGVSVLCPGMVRTRLNETTTQFGGPSEGAPQYQLEEGMDPVQVANCALQGIRKNLLHIFTHGDAIDRIEARHKSLLADYHGR